MVSTRKSSVAVVMGSDSDLKIMDSCISQLKEFDIDPIVRVISAHRTPDVAAEFAENARSRGVKVIIAAAGLAAHLAGAIASRTTLPVIGVPMSASDGLAGLDALLSTVQMPPGVPVATVAIGKPGAKNAAVLAVQMLGIDDKQMADKLNEFKKAQQKKVKDKDANIQ